MFKGKHSSKSQGLISCRVGVALEVWAGPLRFPMAKNWGARPPKLRKKLQLPQALRKRRREEEDLKKTLSTQGVMKQNFPNFVGGFKKCNLRESL